jgi:hypothetical protein
MGRGAVSPNDVDLVGLTGDAAVIEAEGIAQFVGPYLQMSEAGFSHTTRHHGRVFYWHDRPKWGGTTGSFNGSRPFE